MALNISECLISFCESRNAKRLDIPTCLGWIINLNAQGTENSNNVKHMWETSACFFYSYRQTINTNILKISNSMIWYDFDPFVYCMTTDVYLDPDRALSIMRFYQ